MISILFFVLVLFAASAPLLNNMTIQQEQPAICSAVDILMSFSNPTVILKEYLCHSV
jgi:hypothetical protein